MPPSSPGAGDGPCDADVVEQRPEPLANRIAGKQMVPFLLFPPSTAEQCTFRDHVGDEFVIVLAGSVELSFPDRAERLDAGDSAYFRGGTAHHFRSLGAQPAQVLVVVSAVAERVT